MDAGSRDAVTPPEAPFVLLAGSGLLSASSDAPETALRHMGLRPEAVASTGAEAAMFRLCFGNLRVLAGRAGPLRKGIADPDDRATSLLGVSLPSDWRGNCWFFTPEVDPGAERPSFDQFYRMLVLLIDLFGARQLFWSPARLWTDAGQFRSAIAEMQTSGMPPVLHLVAFRRRDGAAGETVATRGLATLCGQELEAPVPPGWDMAAMVKRLARLALDMMLNGPVVRAQRTPGLASGEWVGLTPRARPDGGPATVLVEFSHDR